MLILVAGLTLFFAVHLAPCAPTIKVRMVERISPKGYVVAFNLLSLLSLVLIVIGLKRADFIELYRPPAIGRTVALMLMLPAVYLFFSNSVGPAPSSAQVWTAHPMNWGIVVWSIAHLLANGDLAHVLLFSTFGLYSIVSMLSANARGAKPKRQQRPPLAQEGVFVLVVLLLYTALLWAHAYFTGVALV